MKKTLIATLLSVTALTAHADVIRCTFTEPFVDSSYSMTQSTLTYNNLYNEQGEVYSKTIQNVSFQIKGPGQFELVAKGGKVLQTLTLNMDGSDGMSDSTYPYHVVDTSDEVFPGVNGGVGGCTSNYMKKTEPDLSK